MFVIHYSDYVYILLALHGTEQVIKKETHNATLTLRCYLSSKNSKLTGEQ